MSETVVSERVKITCYGQEKEWNRQEAITFYYEGYLNCEGSERERYAIILDQLCNGETVCTDEY